jgi:DNA (cytosine-5)-methyltransferase 1
LLQGFPTDYEFVSSAEYRVADVARLIGNAVPPPLGKAIGEAILGHVEKDL